MADNQRALMLALAERERRAREQAAEDGGQPRDQAAAEDGGQPRGALREFASDVNRMASQFTAGAMSLTPRFVQEPLIERGLIIDPSEAPTTAMESAFRYMGAAAPLAAGGHAAGVRALSTAPGQIMQYPGVFRGILQDIGRFAQSRPGAYYVSETAGAAGAGLAGHVAREGDAGPVGQLTAEALGGLTAGGLTAAIPSTARGVRDAVLANLAPMTKEGGMIRAARQTQARAGGSERAAVLAGRLDDIFEGVTPAQWIGDDNLLMQESRILADNPDLLPRVRADLEEARLIAQESLRDARGQPRTREDWEHAVLTRVSPEGANITRGQTDEMLDSAYNSFAPLYDEAKGYPVNTRELRNDLIDSALAPEVISTTKERRAVRSWLDNQYTAIEKRSANELGANSTDLLDLRSRIRGERRNQMKRGNQERADLLSQAESVITSRLDSQLPDEAVEILRAADSQYRKYKVVENAVYSAGDSNLTPEQLSESIRTGGLSSSSQYARGRDETVQELREIALGGRSTEEVLGDPRRAALFVRGLDEEGKRAVQADFLNVLFNRAKGSAAEATEAGTPLLRGRVLITDIAENRPSMRALGFSDREIARITDMAKTIDALGKKSPGAVSSLFEDGPASIMQLAAAVLGAQQGQRIAGSGLGSNLVLAQFMSNKARSTLARITSDQAERLMTDAATDPVLYRALLTKKVSNPATAKSHAKRLESWLLSSAAAEGSIQEESQ